MFKNLKLLIRTIFLLLALTFLNLNPAASQAQQITLTIAIPENFISPQVLASFKQQYPNVEVIAISPDYPALPDDFLVYAETADVLYLSDTFLNQEVTRSGYLLNLEPLIATEHHSVTDDFFPSALSAYQWDGGIWAIPSALTFHVLRYDRAAFDRLGLDYPTPQWTLSDFAHLNQRLYEADEPIFNDMSGLLLRSFYAGSFYDQHSTPYMPNFNTPELVDVLAQWNQAFNITEAMINNQDAIIGVAQLPTRASQSSHSYTLLPNGGAGLLTDGLAISSGTAYPEMAYALIQHLTASPEFLLNQMGNLPARISVAEAIKTEQQLPDDLRDLQAVALQNALSTSDRLYTDYILNVMSVLSPDISHQQISDSLQRAEALARENRTNALAISQTLKLSVTPPDRPIQAPNAVTLHFGHILTASSESLPWERLIGEFVNQDPLVTDITLTPVFSPENSAELDCFYTYNAVPNLDLSLVLALNPLMDADPNFNRDDFVSGALSQVQRDDYLWAYPIDISPTVLWYDRDTFNAHDIPEPVNGWTATEFEFALQALNSQPDAVVGSFRGSYYLYQLMAAYGGIPFDYRQSPPTINFTDAKTVDAIRHVLDMARENILAYQRLYIPPEGAPTWHGGGGFSIYSGVLASRPTTTGDWQVTMLPYSTSIVPINYQLQAAYISASTLYPEACYRWISFFAQHPDLYKAMPAQRSLLYADRIQAVLGDNVLNFFQQYEQILQSPDVLVFPMSGSNSDLLVEQIWLHRAFDRYVLEDADLEAELALAEQYVLEYRACVAAIDHPAAMSSSAYVDKLHQCRIGVDPSLG